MSAAPALHEDLLHYIFLHCLPSTIINNTENVRMISPFNVSLVCRSWRKVALSSPRLWSSLHITIDENHEHFRKGEKLCELVDYWLRLSSSSPLSIHYAGTAKRDHAIPKILNRFIQERYRWKTASINLKQLNLYNEIVKDDPFHVLIHPFVLVCNSKSPLSSLELDFPGMADPFVTVDLSDSDSTSSLEVLKLERGAQLMLPENLEKLHLPNLRHLGRYLDTVQASKETPYMLERCPSLESLRLRILGMDVPDSILDGQTKIITLPHLTHIDFYSYVASADMYRLLLGTLSCPSLLSLRVNAGYRVDRLISLPRYTDFLLGPVRDPLSPRPLKLPLVELMLMESYPLPQLATQIDAGAFAHLFQHLCSLEKLHVDTHDATPLFRVLSIPQSLDGFKNDEYGDDADALCPSLKEIYLRSTGVRASDGISVVLDEAVEMIVSRWKYSVESLRRVTIEFTAKAAVLWSARVREDKRIRACIEEGLILDQGTGDDFEPV